MTSLFLPPPQHRPRRRQVLQATVSVFGAALPLASSRAADRYAKYRGQTVAFSIPDHPHYDAMVKLLPRFTQETGIQVELSREHILRMKHRQLAELSQARSSFDLVSYVATWKSEYVSKQLIHPLAPFLQNPALADPGFDLADVVPGYLQNIGLVGGPKGYLPGPGARLYGLPYGAETSVLAYRRDVFATLAVQPPTTYAQLRQLLPVLRSKSGMAALTSRGQMGHNCVHAWLLHLSPLGGRVFDAHWVPTFQQTPGVQALQLLKEIADTGPEGMANFGYNEMLHTFLDGRSAMYLDSTAVFGAVRSSPLSRVDGKVGYALHPRGTRRASQTGGLGLAIARTSERANAAFLLMQWLTSKAQDKAVCALGAAPLRLSTLRDAELLRRYPEFALLREQLRYADPDWRPIISVWDEINTGPLGAAVHQGLTGAVPPEQALSAILGRVTDILVAGGYR
ncbi:MAG: ABC transporter substrate-binding protein [Curvibacter sp. RIFCSPHIGHO2_12_FULL_63_18]|uniref:ABC transporter substrate-binding protein n=1 Tax=Rhodoferax sp. TaxID=50421 RepID=UPI0008BA41B5|nr:extracellular solute-binding protein [Rhodoferax sp.]OGO95793.1 MAG: ABC transporter substrate-binding protein [Curvibacter sp. GWA2_63_95]OGP05727.1 MAG: ABC transporter substrate-binding protein [Curvibacter sp. RIFCSPHIGHO2_12_FULL_63_18]HCX81577.1 ABC transporter substrate-binding protein [Rhodoferax sp.]